MDGEARPGGRGDGCRRLGGEMVSLGGLSSPAGGTYDASSETCRCEKYCRSASNCPSWDESSIADLMAGVGIVTQRTKLKRSSDGK